MDAHEVLEQAALAYATCRTYRDRGVVETVFPHTSGPRVDRKPFTTLFARPLRLRYEFRHDRRGDGGDDFRCIIWADGAAAGDWWSADRMKHYEPLDALASRHGVHPLSLALAGATGVSAGSAHTVPRLLLPDIVGGRSVLSARRPELEGVERAGRFECYVVVAGGSTIWIDTETWLIRRWHERMPFEWVLGQHTTTYNAEFDAVLDSEDFEAWPPRLV